MSAQPLPRITPEQYLEAERAAEFKSEYYKGRIYAMAGGTAVHSLITVNVTVSLSNAIRGRGCLIFSSDLRLRISYEGLYTYPDLSVVCGKPKYADERDDTILNPILVVEILSPSTESRDRGFKFQEYGKLESLQEYVLVEQSQPRVERFQRQPKGQWLLTVYEGLEAEAEFESVGARIRLADVYQNVTFPPSQDENRMV